MKVDKPIEQHTPSPQVYLYDYLHPFKLLSKKNTLHLQQMKHKIGY